MATKAEATPIHCLRVRRSLRNIHASMTVTPEKRELNTEATSSRPACPDRMKKTFPANIKNAIEDEEGPGGCILNLP